MGGKVIAERKIWMPLSEEGGTDTAVPTAVRKLSIARVLDD